MAKPKKRVHVCSMCGESMTYRYQRPWGAPCAHGHKRRYRTYPRFSANFLRRPWRRIKEIKLQEDLYDEKWQREWERGEICILVGSLSSMSVEIENHTPNLDVFRKL